MFFHGVRNSESSIIPPCEGGNAGYFWDGSRSRTEADKKVNYPIMANGYDDAVLRDMLRTGRTFENVRNSRFCNVTMRLRQRFFDPGAVHKTAAQNRKRSRWSPDQEKLSVPDVLFIQHRCERFLRDNI